MEAFQKLGAFLLGRVGSNPAVRTATTRLTFWTGPEQLFLMITGYFALVLILLRGLASLATARGAVLARDNIQATTRSERRLETFVTDWLKAKATDPDPAVRTYWKDLITDELISGRWPVRFAIATLPAIGFIGTVRGILLSLSNADAIVWASTQADRADAISTLSGSLGLAFATTMIALLIGVFISLLSALEGLFEERTMLTLFRHGKVGTSPVPPVTPAVHSKPSPDVAQGRPAAKQGGRGQ
jgi:biopolymer transport protein ExbB/TolQ